MSEERIRVDLVLPSAGGGGAEMHGIRIIKHLDENVFAPRLIAFRGGGTYESALPAGMPRIALCPPSVKSSLWSTIRSMKPLETLWRKSLPDVVLSFLPHTHAVVSRVLRGVAARPSVVLGVQNNVDREIGTFSMQRLIFPGEPQCAYRNADAIVALSEGVGRNFTRYFPDLSERVHVIYNVGCESDTANLASERSAVERPAGRSVVVACGRLEKQKDYPTLLKAFSLLTARPRPELWVLGRGKLDARLRELCDRLGIGERVKFLGFQANPFCFMASADIFVLSSQWEGFGNVIVEAMACGAPVVSTDCPYGPAEILNGGEYGRLVPVGNISLLAQALDDLLANEAMRRRLSLLGVERAKEYLPKVIVPKYEGLLRRMALRPASP